MNEKYIAQIEAQLEQIVEGAFTNLFRKRLNAHDIAMKLARAMENTLRYAQDGDSRPIAPDSYTIRLHSSSEQKLLQNRPDLPLILGQHIVELVAQSGYRLMIEPVVQLVKDDTLSHSDIEVEAIHTADSANQTEAMQAIPLNRKKPPKNPQLIINNGQRTISLLDPVLNIGRGDDNHIILDDPYCSRHHIQLRLRFGAYTLFDVNSSGGTRVNNVQVSEHQLQSGDVINIGHSQLTYIVEIDTSDTTGTTQSLDPVTF
ncbi:MAG: hypothetical protein Phog2KO_00470 [Phototrophicaceae bacterium]